ncbi:MAG TPA: hypothetical protein PK467_19835, partial [Candidatus Wallbacteria bacterium]|nr:hypothetical protein [Candidatus Wallbacteria bacterium]
LLTKSKIICIIYLRICFTGLFDNFKIQRIPVKHFLFLGVGFLLSRQKNKYEERECEEGYGKKRFGFPGCIGGYSSIYECGFRAERRH